MKKYLSLIILLAAAAAAAPLPDAFKLPAGFAVDEKFSKEFDYLHVEFSLNGKHSDVAGRTWSVRLAATPPNKAPDITHAAIKAALKAQGWEILNPGGGLIAQHSEGGKELWLSGSSSADDFRCMIVEAGPPPHVVTLIPPAKTPETVGAEDDFPYLGKMPGSTFQKTISENKSFAVTAPGQSEQLAGPPIVTKFYALRASSSSYERMVVYRDALAKAGWTILKTSAGSDSLVVAHYVKDGRDLFAYLHDGNFSVADVGAQNEAKKLSDALSKDGHVAIYGIYFDIAKDDLKPESETALNHILGLLKSFPTLKLEVQGHTDNSGTAPKNQPLSELRAAAVKKWLVARGIDAARLTPKGYGATMPVADNNSAEGRAKNRRVELKKL